MKTIENLSHWLVAHPALVLAVMTAAVLVLLIVDARRARGKERRGSEVSTLNRKESHARND